MKMALVAAVLLLVLVGLPLVVLPSGFIAFLGLAAAVLCAGGIAARVIPLVTAGATLATIEYASAVSLAAGPPKLVSAVAFGVTLFLLIELVELMRNVRGTAVGAAVLSSVIRYWLVIGGIAVGATSALLLGAAAVRWAIPLPEYLATTIAGALGTFVAAVGVVKLLARSDESSTCQETSLSLMNATQVRRGV